MSLRVSTPIQPIRLHVLGGADLRHPVLGAAGSVLAQPKRFALLAYLALANPGAFARRDTLLALFWPESDTERARSSLRSSLHSLRKALGDGVIRSRGSEDVGLDPERLWCDADAFRTSLDAGNAEGALALYRGDLLAGFNLSGALGWDHWLDAERQDLRDRAASAAWALVESAEGEGRAADAAAWARRAAGFTAADEEPHRRLLALLDRIGDRSAAIRAHEEFSRRLAAEYDLEPSVKTRVLVEAIRYKQEQEEHGPAEEASVRVRNPERRPPVPHDSPLPELSPTPAAGTSTSPKRLFPGRRTAAALAAVLLLVLVGVWWMGREPAPAEAAGSASRLAILPFAVRGTSEWAYLSDGMVDLLSAKLDGAGRLRTVDPRALIGSLEVKGGVVDPERGQRFAARFGADLYLLGSVVSQGERLQLSAALYQHERGLDAPLSEATVEGPAADLPRLVDALAARILAGQLRGPGARMGEIATRTTSSLPALRAYLRGESDLRSGDTDQAVQAFEEAVALDSTFALAWYRLSTATAASGWRIGSAAEQAVRYADRLPPHDRLLLRAWRASWDFRYGESEQLYRDALAAQPYDVEAWVQLGRVLFHGGPQRGRPATDAAPLFRRVLVLDANNSTALSYLTRIAARERSMDTMDSLIARALTMGDVKNGAPYLHALRGVLLGEQTALDRAVTELRDVNDLRLWTTVWRVLEDTEAPARAGRLLRLLTDSTRSDDMRASGYITLAHAELARGRWTAAQPHLRAAESLDPEMALQARVLFATLPFLPVPRAEVERARSALLRRGQGVPDAPPGPTPPPHSARPVRPEIRRYQLGLLEARLGNTAGALAYARSLDGLALGSDARMPASSLADGIRAQVAWLGGPVADPISVLAPAWRERNPKPEVFPFVFGPAHPRFLHAELLRRAGRDREALQWYRSVLEDYDYGLIYAAPVHLRQAEILGRLGESAAAAEHYRRFLALWSDADPSLHPQLRTVQQRLRRLR